MPVVFIHFPAPFLLLEMSLHTWCLLSPVCQPGSEGAKAGSALCLGPQESCAGDGATLPRHSGAPWPLSIARHGFCAALSPTLLGIELPLGLLMNFTGHSPHARGLTEPLVTGPAHHSAESRGETESGCDHR